MNRSQTGALPYNPWPKLREAELLALVPARMEPLAAGLTMRGHTDTCTVVGR